MKAIGVHDFAGAFALGVSRAGFELIAKREGENGAGIQAWERNRRLLKYKGDDLQASPADEWEPRKADLVFGNPPCSAFSVMTNVSTLTRTMHYGADSSINQCMYDLVGYAGSCDPMTVIFESVQGAYKRGHGLMLELRGELERESGKRYTLTHVLHSGISNGAAQIRPRYFWVASRKPFGVEPHPLRLVTTVRDRIGDLADKQLGTMDGHECLSTPSMRRHLAMLDDGVEWREGEKSKWPIRRAGSSRREVQERYGFTGYEIDSDNAFRPRRLHYDRPSYIIAGDSVEKFVHPELPRFITFREALRLMGFPDTFNSWDMISGRRGMTKGPGSPLIGKQIPVENGAWIAKWARLSLEGKPGSVRGDKIGDREYVIDLTHLWKEQLGIRSGFAVAG